MRRQIGEMAADRLLHIDLAAAGPLLGIGVGAVEIGVRDRPRGPRRAGRSRAAARRVVVGPDQLEPVRERLARRLGQAVGVRADGDDRADTSPAIPAARPSRSQQLRLHQDGGDVIGIDGQRAIEARHAALEVAGQVEAPGRG